MLPRGIGDEVAGPRVHDFVGNNIGEGSVSCKEGGSYEGETGVSNGCVEVKGQRRINRVVFESSFEDRQSIVEIGYTWGKRNR